MSLCRVLLYRVSLFRVLCHQIFFLVIAPSIFLTSMVEFDSKTVLNNGHDENKKCSRFFYCFPSCKGCHWRHSVRSNTTCSNDLCFGRIAKNVSAFVLTTSLIPYNVFLLTLDVTPYGPTTILATFALSNICSKTVLLTTFVLTTFVLTICLHLL